MGQGTPRPLAAAAAELITPTDITFDRRRIAEAYQILSGLAQKRHAVAVTSKPGSTDPLHEGTAARPDEDMLFTEINQEFRGTYIEEILRSLPFRFGRTRMMSVPAQKCYPVHADDSLRYHLALETHPGAFIAFPDAGKMYRIPDDGRLYRMDARYPHTAVNCGPLTRTHLVIITDHEG